MGARQSRRSVDITTTPKKEGLPAEGVVGDAAAPGDGKLEKIEEADAKPTTNGVALHTDATPEDKDKDEATEKEEKEKEDAPKVEELKVESPTSETPAEGAAEATTPSEGTPASPTTATSPESKETKKKDKPKKKWSFRSISFGKKDKNKPVREDAPKNGDVAKETLAEGGEEAENAAVASSPADEKSAASSPTEKDQSETLAEAPAAATASSEAKAEEDASTGGAVAAPAAPAAAAAATAAAVAVATSPVEEKKEEPSTPAPTPVPIEAKKVEEMEKEVEAANADKTVEVSPVQAVIEAPVEVNSQSKPIATTSTATTTTATTAPSIIERKTSEEFPSQFPSSPPPTPIDPSPLQQAQQVGANASAIAEALKLPAEAANKASSIANASAQAAASTVLTGSPPVSSRRVVETSPTTATSAILPTEQPPSDRPVSKSPEQTGNASPIPVTIVSVTATTTIDTTTTTAAADAAAVAAAAAATTTTTTTTTTAIVTVTDTIQETSSESQKANARVTEVVARYDETLGSDRAEPIVNEENEARNRVGSVIEETIESESLVETIESTEARENDLVIETEEGPIPVSSESDVVVGVDAEPILATPDSPIEEIESVEIPIKGENDRRSGESRAVERVDSSESPIEAGQKEFGEIPETVTVPPTTVPVLQVVNEEHFEKDVPPPLPASPIPVPKATSQLLNFMSTQIEDCSVIADIINSAKDAPVLAESKSRTLSPPVEADLLETKERIEKSQSRIEEQTDTSRSSPPFEDASDSRLEQLLIDPAKGEALSASAAQQILEEAKSCQSLDGNMRDTEMVVVNSGISEVEVVSPVSFSKIPTDTTLLTPPRSPSPTAVIKPNDVELTTRESSQLELLDDSSNREFKMESVEESLNSYNDSELELKERLSETLEEYAPVDSQLLNTVQENDQSKLEAPVENNVIANDIGTTETNDDAPKSPPPAVPAETPAPTLGPAITEDVASVTKAIEEIDINEKAVAAAVNENIESANTNEIISDMNHQNNMNE